jgi:hypothetical protein
MIKKTSCTVCKRNVKNPSLYYSANDCLLPPPPKISNSFGKNGGGIILLFTIGSEKYELSDAMGVRFSPFNAELRALSSHYTVA